ncbi:MAG: type II toxin-antitoxin system death-on-curing family toxin [Pirellulales bacterium]|nr:type II toxin-antitoxin system death-on-curing family toxin [Pirellulales bacterium]
MERTNARLSRKSKSAHHLGVFQSPLVSDMLVVDERVTTTLALAEKLFLHSINDFVMVPLRESARAHVVFDPRCTTFDFGWRISKVLKKSETVRQLAQKANLSVDEALYALWEVGLEQLVRASDRVFGKDLRRARIALQIPARAELISRVYWQRQFKLSDDQFDLLLCKLGITCRPGTQRLPKGVVARLKAEARHRAEPNLVAVTADREYREDTPPPKLQWRIVGHDTELRMLTEEELLQIHMELVRDFVDQSDPIEPSGIRNQALLGSAIHRPHTCLGKEQKYPSVEMSAAALAHALIHDHPFHNGNKRTALVALLVFLDENGLMLTCNEDELFKFVLKVAKHTIVDRHRKDLADREVMAMATWIHKSSRLVEKGDRPISFNRLRQILTDYDCIFAHPEGKGNRINISRPNKAPRGRWTRRVPDFMTQVAYGDEGRDVQKNTVSKIRKDLHLDEEHGIDSKTFYDGASVSPSDFIVKYRKTLSRLARL